MPQHFVMHQMISTRIVCGEQYLGIKMTVFDIRYSGQNMRGSSWNRA